MTWLRLDDSFYDHPKIDGLTDPAFRLHVAAANYCARHLTDGHITAPAALRLTATSRQRTIDELVTAHLWDPTPDGYEIHDFLRYNPTREQVEADRRGNARRQALWRNPGLKDTVRRRDEDRCRYCGHTVRWNDRRGPLGGTYDHVDPHGENTVDNLVVACRGCNSAKSNRTPEQAGMPLRPSHITNNGTGSEPDSARVPTRPVRGGSGTSPPLSDEPALQAPSVAPLTDTERHAAAAELHRIRTTLTQGETP